LNADAFLIFSFRYTAAEDAAAIKKFRSLKALLIEMNGSINRRFLLLFSANEYTEIVKFLFSNLFMDSDAKNQNV
jgi:hypothetical protein